MVCSQYYACLCIPLNVRVFVLYDQLDDALARWDAAKEDAKYWKVRASSQLLLGGVCRIENVVGEGIMKEVKRGR